jgi:hypothetical protein
MREEITSKIKVFLDRLYHKFAQHGDRITICSVGSAQYINYLLEKGIISYSESKDLQRKAIEIIEMHNGIEIPDFVKHGLVEIMNNVESYEYEIISKFIK